MPTPPSEVKHIPTPPEEKPVPIDLISVEPVHVASRADLPATPTKAIDEGESEHGDEVGEVGEVEELSDSDSDSDEEDDTGLTEEEEKIRQNEKKEKVCFS